MKEGGIVPNTKDYSAALFEPERRGEYVIPLPRANLIIVRDHLQNAMRAGLNSEALRCVVAAIKELDR